MYILKTNNTELNLVKKTLGLTTKIIKNFNTSKLGELVNCFKNNEQEKNSVNYIFGERV
jgi:hypothetical protein